MKLSSLSTLVLLLPAFVSAMSLPEEGLVARKNNNGNTAADAVAAKASQAAANNAAQSAAAANQAAQASAIAAASATSTSAAASSTSTAASGGGTEDAQAAQSSLTLLSSQVSTGFENNGQDVPEAGQVASLTSSNNFINFCAQFANLPLTNGQQVTTGSCNNAIMGVIPASSNIPSGKFVSPANGDTVAANTAFTVTMAVKNIELGNFVNAKENYYSAPQQVNSAGLIIGHSHFVIEEMADGLGTTTPTNPLDFAFFQGVNAAQDANGQVSISVSDGLPAGVYRLGSIMSSSNHQPTLAPIAQHGLMDDVVYFTVSDSGAAASNATAAAGTAAAGAAAGAAAAGAAKGANNAGTAATGAAAGTAAAGAAASSAAAAKGANNNAGTAAKGATNAATAAKGAATAAKGAQTKGANNANTAQGKNGAQAKKARRSFFNTDY